MYARNKVIAGDYKGAGITSTFGTATLSKLIPPTQFKINNKTVQQYEIINESKRKSATSAIGMGLLGSFFLGPIGLLAAVGAEVIGVHIIAIQFTNGKRSLVEVDDKIFKAIIGKCF